jgi:hypothetical protein
MEKFHVVLHVKLQPQGMNNVVFKTPGITGVKEELKD